MPSYSTPGVYVTESTLASLVPNPVGGTTAVFFGEAARGPLTPTVITDWGTYKATYGDLDNAYDLGFAVYHFFANGGRACYVRRVLNSTAVAASVASVPFYPTGNGNASSSLFTVTTLSAGTWGNNITVQVSVGNILPTSSTLGTFTVVVNYAGSEVERWSELSLDANSSRYVATVINTYSRYVVISAVNTTATANSALAYYGTASSLSGGTQSTVADSDYVSALADLDTIQGMLLLNAVGKNSSTVTQAFTTKAQSRGDSFVLIDPTKTDAAFADLQTTATALASVTNGGYAAHYTPMLKMIDPSKSGPAAIRNTYPCGAVAGLIARTEAERNVAKAPAGYAADIRGAIAPVVKLSDAQIGTLYDGTPQANTFKTVPGGGVVVFGARTLSKTSADKFISVRRTLNYVKFNLNQLTQFAVFEPNDAALWDQLNLVVSAFLSDMWRSGALKGARSSDAFYVVCDSSNNTPVTQDAGQVNVQVGVALQYPAEFVVINISQWTGGSNTATVTGA